MIVDEDITERRRKMKLEIELYTQELCWLLDQVGRCIGGLTQQQLSWRPASDTANSASAITTHVISSTRVYSLGFGWRQPVSRHRAAEFSASDASVHALLAALQQLTDEITAATSSAIELDERFVPPAELWGATVPVREISRREALVESIRHAALHLGELRLTCDLAQSAST